MEGGQPSGQPRKEEEEFDFAALHPEIENPLSNFKTFITLVKAALGTGFLALPSAFANAGVITGTFIGVFIALLNGYLITYMIKLKHKACVRENIPCSTLPVAMGLGYQQGPPCIKKVHWLGSKGVTFTLGAYQIGILCVYYVFIIENMGQICDYYYTKHPIYVYYLAGFPIFCLLMLVRQMKYLAICANVAVFATIGCIIIIFCYVFRGPLDFSGTQLTRPASTLLLFLGTTMFATNNLGVALSLEGKMKSPKSFKKVYFSAVFVVIITCMGFGNICYMKYTKDTRGSITLNLPSNEHLAQSVKIIYSLTVFISYGLYSYATVELIINAWWPDGPPPEKEFVIDFSIRCAICVFCCFMGILIPKVGKLISLVGCLCLPMLYYFFPTILDISLHWQDPLRQKELHCMKDTFLILFGIFATTVGTASAIIKIVKK